MESDRLESIVPTSPRTINKCRTACIVLGRLSAAVCVHDGTHEPSISSLVTG
jgi:hypothetical protein